MVESCLASLGLRAYTRSSISHTVSSVFIVVIITIRIITIDVDSVRTVRGVVCILTGEQRTLPHPTHGSAAQPERRQQHLPRTLSASTPAP